ncbi:MAG: LysE family translocator [Pseudomonadota bacterium]
MVDWAGLSSIFAAFFVVAASPGPATLAVSAASANYGRHSGIVFAAGLALGLAFWGIVAATGLGALLQASTHALMALKLAGGAYLIWLAYGSAKQAAVQPSETPNTGLRAATENARLFSKGLFLNLSNPKAVVAWMAALSVGLGADDGLLNLMLATFGCALIGLLIYCAYAAAFSMAAVMQGYARLRRKIDGLVAILFATAGFALIRSAFAKA